MDTYPVEAKVTAATLAAFAASLVLALCNAVIADSSILGPLPGWAQFLILTLAPTVAIYAAGYSAPHTPRD